MRTRINPTQTDLRLARAIARNTRPAPEALSQTLTYAADEHVLLALTAAYWLYCRTGSAADKCAGDHVLATTIAASIIPHLLKSMFYQIRPDRRTLRGHLHGVPLSGNAFDAFPSGHAIHVGALASAASRLREPLRTGVWLVGGVLAATRVALLAHWLTDVVAGFGLGVVLERGLRFVTGFGRSDAPSR